MKQAARYLVAVLSTAVVAVVAPTAARAVPTVDPTVPADRSTEPVVLTGAQLADWAAPANLTVKAPLTDLQECQEVSERDACAHNRYVEPEIDSQRVLGQSGTATDRILAFRWDEGTARFREVPVQVDEIFTRYLENQASGFAGYSGADAHTTVAFDREGFRFTKTSPRDPCRAVPDSPVATDPVPGLDTNDEVVFMASDAGAAAPAGAPLPDGVEAVHAVTVRDPLAPSAVARTLYLMRTAAKGPGPSFDVGNGYVRYRRDANADEFVLGQSSYDNYGNAAPGPYCDGKGHVVTDPKTGGPAVGKRRPLDTATVSTARYQFRYDGRWVMSSIRIAPKPGAPYGPDLIDRWKARAYAQDPASKTPCCGFEEEEEGNWGGSSTLLGERAGPVRVIRETWGSDSGTNVVRRETFYREEFRQTAFLRVHPLPPLGGIYAQWDFNAGRVTRFYNPSLPDGVAIDGRNDEEVMGTFDDACNAAYDQPGRYSAVDDAFRQAYKATPICAVSPYHYSTDVMDPTTSQVGLPWTEVAGPWGTIVDRFSIDVKDSTPGGAAQSVLTLPYYRDDSCFDDGTGTDPGPRRKLRSADEPRTSLKGGPRRCWAPADGIPDGTDRFFQGDIASHGINLQMVAESDNARTTLAVTEMVSEQRVVLLPGDQGNVGERFGRGFEKPLLASVG